MWLNQSTQTPFSITMRDSTKSSIAQQKISKHHTLLFLLHPQSCTLVGIIIFYLKEKQDNSRIASDILGHLRVTVTSTYIRDLGRWMIRGSLVNVGMFVAVHKTLLHEVINARGKEKDHDQGSPAQHQTALLMHTWLSGFFFQLSKTGVPSWNDILSLCSLYQPLAEKWGPKPKIIIPEFKKPGVSLSKPLAHV